MLSLTGAHQSSGAGTERNTSPFILFQCCVVGLCRCEAQRSMRTIESKMYRFCDLERSRSRREEESKGKREHTGGKREGRGRDGPFHCMLSSTAIIGNMVAMNQLTEMDKAQDH